MQKKLQALILVVIGALSVYALVSQYRMRQELEALRSDMEKQDTEFRKSVDQFCAKFNDDFCEHRKSK